MKKGSGSETFLAIFAGLLLIAGGVGIYWTRENGIQGDLVYAPGLLLTSVSIVLSLFALFRRRWPMALRPIVVNGVMLFLFAYMPWHSVGTRIDFQMKKNELETVAAVLQYSVEGANDIVAGDTKSLEYDKGRMFVEIRLTDRYRDLTTYGFAYTADTACGKFVYFPNQPSISERRSGFLYTPSCEEPKNFPGVGFDVRWWPAKKINEAWSSITGT